MLMTGVSSALGAAVYFVYYIHCTTLLMYMVKRKKTLLHDQTVYIYIYLLFVDIFFVFGDIEFYYMFSTL
jgi:hypothetical protein